MPMPDDKNPTDEAWLRQQNCPLRPGLGYEVTVKVRAGSSQRLTIMNSSVGWGLYASRVPVLDNGTGDIIEPFRLHDLPTRGDVRAVLAGLRREYGWTYLHLLHGHPTPEGDDTNRESGPTFGPFDFVQSIHQFDIVMNGYSFGGSEHTISAVDGLVYYDGMYYSDWTVTAFPNGGPAVPFDPAKAVRPVRPAE